jgi:SAM-dependent methyltransferase
VTSSYFGGINQILLSTIPVDAERVLELGCGEGAFAAEYKSRNPRAQYHAVEIHPASAAVARNRVDRLFEGDFETMDDAELTGDGGGYDVVVMGDVLEHLRDPWRALERVRGLLRPGGYFGCCVPHVGHWTALAELLNGRWPYQDEGLFDRTHLRFFTLDSLTRMLADAGLATQRVRRTELSKREETDRWVDQLGAALEKLGVDRAGFVERASTYQYVVGARRAGDPRPQVVQLAMMAMAPKFLDVRTRLPAAQLGSLPDLVVSYGERRVNVTSMPPGTPRILVQQRPRASTEEVWLETIGGTLNKGWLVVVEFDDHPELFKQLGRGSRGEGISTTLSGAHAVQTSTPALLDAFREHNPEVAAFGNALFQLPPWRERADGPATVFFGALNREGFSGRIAEALAPAIAAHPETEFVVLHDKAFFAALPTERKRFLPAQPYDEYLAAMRACDIALMPLEGTFGERFKSDVKFLEASGAGLASIASPTVYGDTIRHGETGLIAASVEDWPVELARLLDDPGQRRRMARAAWEYARDERMFAYQTRARADWYRSLWARRAELTDALVQRHPGLERYLPPERT